MNIVSALSAGLVCFVSVGEASPQSLVNRNGRIPDVFDTQPAKAPANPRAFNFEPPPVKVPPASPIVTPAIPATSRITTAQPPAYRPPAYVPTQNQPVFNHPVLSKFSIPVTTTTPPPAPASLAPASSAPTAAAFARPTPVIAALPPSPPQPAPPPAPVSFPPAPTPSPIASTFPPPPAPLLPSSVPTTVISVPPPALSAHQPPPPITAPPTPLVATPPPAPPISTLTTLPAVRPASPPEQPVSVLPPRPAIARGTIPNTSFTAAGTPAPAFETISRNTAAATTALPAPRYASVPSAPLSVPPPRTTAPGLFRDSGSGASKSYQLSPNDLLELKVFQEPDLDTKVRVSKDGTVTLPLIGNMKLQGMTVEQAAATIRDQLDKRYLVNPQVNLTVIDYAKRRFTVMGEVQKPGSFEIPNEENVNLLQAIALAGGYTRIGEPTRVTVVRIENGQRVIHKLNAKAMARDQKAPPFEIKPDDTITIGESVF